MKDTTSTINLKQNYGQSLRNLEKKIDRELINFKNLTGKHKQYSEKLYKALKEYDRLLIKEPDADPLYFLKQRGLSQFFMILLASETLIISDVNKYKVLFQFNTCFKIDKDLCLDFVYSKCKCFSSRGKKEVVMRFSQQRLRNYVFSKIKQVERLVNEAMTTQYVKSTADENLFFKQLEERLKRHKIEEIELAKTRKLMGLVKNRGKVETKSQEEHNKSDEEAWEILKAELEILKADRRSDEEYIKARREEQRRTREQNKRDNILKADMLREKSVKEYLEKYKAVKSVKKVYRLIEINFLKSCTEQQKFFYLYGGLKILTILNSSGFPRRGIRIEKDNLILVNHYYSYITLRTIHSLTDLELEHLQTFFDYTIKDINSLLTAIDIGSFNRVRDVVDAYFCEIGVAIPYNGMSVDELVKKGWVKLI